MDVTWTVKYITEFIATAFLLILGNGAVANVDLKGTKGHNHGLVIIAIGYGMGVMMPALMFGNVSGNHINPAFTLGLAISGYFPWEHVAPYIAAQLLGAMFGQLIVVTVYRPYFAKTTEANAILGSFSTISAVDDGTKASHSKAIFNGFMGEFFGSFVLFLGAMALTRNYFGAEIIDFAKQMQPAFDPSTLESKYAIGAHVAAGQTGAHIALGFLVMALVTSMGGATGPGLNPARDLGPRLVHAFLPKSVLGQAKGDSKWWYAWVPVVAPILAAIAAVALYKFVFETL